MEGQTDKRRLSIPGPEIDEGIMDVDGSGPFTQLEGASCVIGLPKGKNRYHTRRKDVDDGLQEGASKFSSRSAVVKMGSGVWEVIGKV